MNIVDKILHEALSTQFIFKTNSMGDDYYKTHCFYEKVGFSIVEILHPDSGYAEVDGVISEDDYNQLVGNDLLSILSGIEIDQHFQNSGVGRELMLKTLDFIKSKNCKTVILNASPIGNKAMDVNDLVNWYKKFGFSELKHQGNNCVMTLKL